MMSVNKLILTEDKLSGNKTRLKSGVTAPHLTCPVNDFNDEEDEDDPY